jgi:hypothetical protein
MREDSIVPAAVLAFLAGWFIRAVVVEPPISAGNVVLAIVTGSVGWWIQRTVRTQAELDRVPLDSVAKLCERLDELVVKCLDCDGTNPSAPNLVQALRLMSNEILWLGTVVDALDTARDEHERLRTLYRDFKGRLTGGPEVEMAQAAEDGRSIRSLCIQIRWQVCRRILASPGNIGSLGGSA